MNGPPNREIKWLEPEEVERLLDAPNTRCPTGLRNRALLQLVYATGLRSAEVLGLAVGDVELEKREVHVRNGKGGKARTVGFDSETEAWLRAWDATRPKRARHFFTTLKGKPVGDRYLRELVSRCAQKAGLDPSEVSPHTLRHSYATRLLQEGLALPDVQRALGHAHSTTTLIYCHALNDKARNDKLRERSLGLGAPEANPQEEADPEPDAETLRLAKVLANTPAEVKQALASMLSKGDNT